MTTDYEILRYVKTRKRAKIWLGKTTPPKEPKTVPMAQGGTNENN